MKNNFELALILRCLYIIYFISVVIYPDTPHTAPVIHRRHPLPFTMLYNSVYIFNVKILVKYNRNNNSSIHLN
jgi:hypothetical protein